jgi:hypothetical protein
MNAFSASAMEYVFQGQVQTAMGLMRGTHGQPFPTHVFSFGDKTMNIQPTHLSNTSGASRTSAVAPRQQSGRAAITQANSSVGVAPNDQVQHLYIVNPRQVNSSTPVGTLRPMGYGGATWTSMLMNLSYPIALRDGRPAFAINNVWRSDPVTVLHPEAQYLHDTLWQQMGQGHATWERVDVRSDRSITSVYVVSMPETQGGWHAVNANAQPLTYKVSVNVDRHGQVRWLGVSTEAGADLFGVDYLHDPSGGTAGGNQLSDGSGAQQPLMR